MTVQGCQDSGNSLGGKSHRAIDSQIRVRRSKEWFNQGHHLAHNETCSSVLGRDMDIFPPSLVTVCHAMSLPVVIVLLLHLLPHGMEHSSHLSLLPSLIHSHNHSHLGFFKLILAKAHDIPDSHQFHVQLVASRNMIHTM